jgi:hypothetical protein
VPTIAFTALSTSAPSPTMSTEVPISLRTPARNMS